MKEVAVRRFHRLLGIWVVWFLAGQTLSGLVLSFGDLAPGSLPPLLSNLLGTLHFGWNPLGSVYRVLLGLTILAQGVSGIIIFFLMRGRTRKT